MRDSYRTETIEQAGKTYRIEWIHDSDHGAPREECDGHGEVSEWTSRSKQPGELVLCNDRGMKRFYNYAGAIKAARADGWNTAPYRWATKGQQAAAAVMADFEYLRQWCNDHWHYCGIVVTLLDDDGEETHISASLWGIEEMWSRESSDYHKTVIDDLIYECSIEQSRITYPVLTCGV